MRLGPLFIEAVDEIRSVSTLLGESIATQYISSLSQLRAAADAGLNTDRILGSCNHFVHDIEAARLQAVLGRLDSHEGAVKTNERQAQLGVTDIKEEIAGSTTETRHETGPTTPDPVGQAAPTSKREERAKWLATAMLLVRDHPEWSDAEIARRVSKAPSTLSRSPEYQAAAAMAIPSGGSNGPG